MEQDSDQSTIDNTSQKSSEILQKLNEAGEFPTDPEQRFEAIIASIGNSAAKQLTLLALSRSLITPKDLVTRFTNLNEGVWAPNIETTRGYCLNTLGPIGLVAEESFIPLGTQDEVVGFRTTKAGEKYGVPIAAYLLSKSADFENSAGTILGQTSAGRGERRSVITRTSILEILSKQSKPTRTIDIAIELGIAPQNIGSQLERMNELGLVTYSAVNNENKGNIKYKISEDADRDSVAVVRRMLSMTREVISLAFELQEFNNDLIYGKLKAKYPGRKEKSFRVDIAHILSALEKQGILEKERFSGHDVQSKAEIAEEGMRVVNEIIIPIKKSLSGDDQLLDLWRKIAWQNFVKDAITKHWENSGNACSKSKEERMDEALTLIRRYPGIRPKDIKSILKDRYYNPRILRALTEEGLVWKEKRGKITYYYPLEQPLEMPSKQIIDT